MAAPKVTGDSPRQDFNTLAASVELPILIDDAGIVGTNTLLKKDHAINQAAYGKKQGAAVLVMKKDGSVGGLAIAQGSANTSKWGILAFESAKDITPTT